MSLFKKCTAMALALTLVGGASVQVFPMIDTGISVCAAEIDDEFIVKDYETGEVISADRLIEIFNTPAEGKENNFIEELRQENIIEEKTNSDGEVTKRVTEIREYMANDLLLPDDDSIVWYIDNTKYDKYTVGKDVYGENHLYLITMEVVHTITETFGDEPKVVNKYKVNPTPAGTYGIMFTKEDGQTYRTFKVSVKQTAKKLNASIKYMNSNKEYILSNGAIVVANHTLQLKAKVDTSSTDELQYRIVSEPSQWASESDLATIDKDGVITTLSNGTAYLEVTHKNGVNYTIPVITTDKDTGDQELNFEKFLPEYYVLNVVKENPAKEITLNEKYNTLKKGDKKQLSVTVTPTYTEDEYPTSATDILTWTSSNTKVAKIDENGLLTAIGPGETVITVMGENNLVKDSFVLNVTVPVSNIEMGQSGVKTYEGMTEDIFATLKPDFADEVIYWKSSNESVVTITSGEKELVKKNYRYNAKLNAKKAGTATVTAYTKSGIQASMTVTVEKLPDIDFIKLVYKNKEISSNTCTIFTGQTLQFTMMSMTGNIEVPFDQVKVTISKGGSDIAKATINKEGLVTLKGISRGSLKLYFKSTINPGYKRTLNVNIKRPADGVEYTIDGEAKKSVVLFIGDTAKVDAKLTTKSADGIHDDSITKFKSENTAIATVDSSGKITAKDEGSTKIYVKTLSSQELKVASVDVIKVSKIVIKQVKDGVYESKEKIGNILDTDIVAYDSNNKSYTGAKVVWTLDKSGVLSVTADNKLKVNKTGVTTVKCKVGGVTTSFKVNITHDIKNVKCEVKGNVELATSVKPTVVLTDGNITLKEGTDYTIDVVKNPVLGKNSTTIHGKGTYFGDTKISFNVIAHSMNEAVVTGINNVVYTGASITPKPVVKFRGTTLKEGTDYTVSYSDNKKVGKATVKISGKGNYKDTITKTFQITPAAISKCTITVADATYSTKTGKGVPKVTVKFGSTTLRENTDYTVTCSGNNKLGVATAVIKGIGNFNSSVSKSFKVTSKYPLKITVPASSYSISVGGTKKLTYTVADASYVTDKSASYSSDNKNVASVDKNGVVTGKKSGNANITINAHGAKATVKIYVK